ncbi:S9 family peptidase [Candidatus Riflebacteria bacterium]
MKLNPCSYSINTSLFFTFILLHCLTIDVESLQPPVAKKVAKKLVAHGHERIDNYFWLKDRKAKEVLDYLRQENEYTKAILKPVHELQEKLFLELKARVKKDDQTVPIKKNNYYYYQRYEKGKEYPIYCRKKGSMHEVEEIILDVNELAKGQSYYEVSGVSLSPDQKILAYAVDTKGNLVYTLYFKYLDTDKVVKHPKGHISPSFAWGNDNKTFFYTTSDKKTIRDDTIWRHVLGSDPGKDELIFHEKDETFYVEVKKSNSKKVIFISSESTLTSEHHFLDADRPAGKFKIIQERKRGLEYYVTHGGDRFFIRTNLHKATNFKLMETSLTRTSLENWKEKIPVREDVLLSGVSAFENYLVLQERKGGLPHIRIMGRNKKIDFYIPFKDPGYSAYVHRQQNYYSNLVRYDYESMTTPETTFDFEMLFKGNIFLKRKEILGGFASENYQTERFFVSGWDNARIPMSIVYRKGLKKNGKTPTLIYAYGSYGSNSDLEFDKDVISLLDRGFIYGIAQIRGGSEMGRKWYEDGRQLKKKNTFNDFISCSEYMISKGYTSSKHLYAYGLSAGGLLMGAITNMRPDLYNGVIAEVPFVDVITTMLDETIPLTTGEFDEWGNPKVKKFYDYMYSYSPYDNVEKKAYPNLLVLAGLHDSQVQYWEPTKWVAKLRTYKTDDNLLLLHTNMSAGHGGASGRFEVLKQYARLYTFLLLLEGYGKE